MDRKVNELQPYYITLTGPDAGRVNRTPSENAVTADGQYYLKEDYPELYQGIGWLLEPARVIDRPLTLRQRVCNWLYKTTCWEPLLQYWTSPIQVNPAFDKDGFHLPNWRLHEYTTVILRQSIKNS